MKKVVLSVAIMSFALLANAQVLKKDLLKDYKPGDQLEKAVYGDKKEPIRTDSWNGAFSTNPLEGVVQSPNQKIPDRKTKCVIKTHINIKQNVIFGAKLKPV